jgi:mono/diheme cytochrome c family protein
VSERRALLAAALLLAAAGCTRFDRAVGAVPWFSTMRDQVAVRPLEAAPGDSATHRFLPPEGAVPLFPVEDSLDIYGEGLAAVDALRNPFPRDAATLRRGRELYDIYCAVCHGAQGGGNGPVAGRFGYVPDLTLDMTKQRSDGYLYAIVRHGRGIMPRYGDRIRDPRERWAVVSYVRQLQGM